MRKLKLLPVFLLIILLGFGCAGLQTSGRDSSLGESPKAPSPTSPSFDGQYVAKSGYITIKVPEGTLIAKFEDTRDDLRAEGGEISNINYNEYGDRKQYSMMVKVPPAKFDAINSMLKEVGEVKDLSVQLEDVTQQYVDLDIRIKNREIELERLYNLYNQSDNVSDLLDVEREITRVETDLEILKQQKQQLESRVQKSAITITMYEEKPATTQLTLSLEGLAAMFFGAVAAAISVLVLAAGFLIPMAIVGAVLWFAYTKLAGRKKGGPKGPEHKKIPPPE